MATELVIIDSEFVSTSATPFAALVVPLAAGQTARTSVIVIATSDDGHAASWSLDALYTLHGGVLTSIGFLKDRGITDNASKNWDVAVRARVEEPGSLECIFTGEAGRTIRWGMSGKFYILQAG